MERSRTTRNDGDAPRRDYESSQRSRDGSRRMGGGSDDEDAPRGRGRDRDEAPRGGSRGNSRGSGYEYKPRSAADTRARADKGANDYDKILKDTVKMWKPNDKDNRIRILPPTWKDPEHFGYDVYVHYGVGPDRQSYLCRFKMLGEADPINEEREKARKELDADDADDQAYIKQLDAKRRVVVYLIDRDNEKEGVQAWAMPWTVDRDIVKVSVDKSTGEVLPIDHPEDGYDVEFEKKGQGARTEYLGVAIARRSSALGKDEWLEYAVENPIPDQLQFYDYAHIAKAFGAQGDHREKAHADRDEAPRGRDRDDAPRSRDRIDPDDKPAGGRDAGSGGRGRDEAEQPARGRSNRDEPALTWESIHSMTGAELDDLIDQEKLDINSKEAKNDEDLADWICEDMKLEKAKVSSRSSGRAKVDDSDDDTAARLRKMRERRE